MTRARHLNNMVNVQFLEDSLLHGRKAGERLAVDSPVADLLIKRGLATLVIEGKAFDAPDENKAFSGPAATKGRKKK